MKSNLLSAFVSVWEKNGLDFYRECIHMSNQFSTKYVLESILQQQKTHTARLIHQLSDVQYDDSEMPNVDQDLKRFFNQDLIEEFDRENLNFVEVTKLAIRMATFYRKMYLNLSEHTQDKNLQIALNLLVEAKTNFIVQLNSEFERLSYDRS